MLHLAQRHKIDFQKKLHPVLDTLPVYVREGSIIPLQPVVQSTDETPNGPLELRIYPGPRCNGSIYLDDGHSFGYQHGEFLRQTFNCSLDGNSIRVGFGARQGSYAPWWKSLELVIYDWPSAQADTKLSNSETALTTSYDASQRALHILLPGIAGEAHLTVGSRKGH